jgi:hypothetical protein
MYDELGLCNEAYWRTEEYDRINEEKLMNNEVYKQ